MHDDLGQKSPRSSMWRQDHRGEEESSGRLSEETRRLFHRLVTPNVTLPLPDRILCGVRRQPLGSAFARGVRSGSRMIDLPEPDPHKTCNSLGPSLGLSPAA